VAAGALVVVGREEIGDAMKTGDFLSKLDEAAVAAAIAQAERLSSGEIRVYVSERKVTDALAHARDQFRILGMERTRERNAVLLFFAPRVRQFAIVGDRGVDAVCGAAFWAEVAQQIGADLRRGDFHGAVVRAVERVGGVLAEHFPRSGDNPDELPNTVVRDPE